MTKLYFKELAFLIGAFALLRSPDEFGVIAFVAALAFLGGLTYLEDKSDDAFLALEAKVKALDERLQDYILKRGGR